MSDLEQGGLSVETGLDSKNAFRDAYAQAEREAAQEAGLIGDDQPRDEQGRFATEEAPQETAAETAEDEADAEPTAAETLLAGRYKSVEELERAHQELQQFAARQGTEIGELRSAFEQRMDDFQERLDTPQQARTQITPDLIEQNPAAAAQLAYEQGDQFALNTAFENWKIEDPAGAATWASDIRATQRINEVEQKYAKKFEEFEQRTQPLLAQSEESALRAAVAALPDETKAFLNNADTVQALSNEFPDIGEKVVSGTADQRVRAIRALHDIHRGRTADTLNVTRQDVARETAEAAQAAREDAYVASTTASQETPKTWEQIEQEKALAGFNRGRDTWDSAFVRPAKK